MPALGSPQTIQEKTEPVIILRIGSHPLVYSVAFILLVGVMVFFFVIVPMVRSLQPGGSASVEDANAKNRAAQNTYDAQKKLTNAAAALSTNERNLLAYSLPAEPDAPGLAVIFKSLAVKSGLKLSGIDISQTPDVTGEESSDTRQTQISIALDLVTYDRLKLFITNTEYSLRLFDLKSMSFSPQSGSGSVQFVSYYLKKL